jgi:hypothetical protein
MIISERIFFFIALFCSIYRSRIRLQAISELGHPSICRMRQGLFLSGGCDTLISRRGHACGLLLGMHSYPAGAISAGGRSTRYTIDFLSIDSLHNRTSWLLRASMHKQRWFTFGTIENNKEDSTQVAASFYGM